ncbi:MAG: hypothetical protein NVS3B7_20570 [Candidatus Elarobacter sp.]
MQNDPALTHPRLLPEGDIPLDADAIEQASDEDGQGDAHDDAVLAADDTGMLAGERFITVVELAEGGSGAEGDLLSEDGIDRAGDV